MRDSLNPTNCLGHQDVPECNAMALTLIKLTLLFAIYQQSCRILLHPSNSYIHLTPIILCNSLILMFMTEPQHWTAITSSSDGNTLAATVGDIERARLSNLDEERSSVPQRECTVVLHRAKDQKFGLRLREHSSGQMLVSDLEPGGHAIKSGMVQISDVVVRVNGHSSNSDMLEEIRICTRIELELSYGAQQRGSIWISGNGGVTWTEETNASGAHNWTSITSSDDGKSLAAVAYDGHIWLAERPIDTTDGAWINVSPSVKSQSWQSVACTADGGQFTAAATHGSIWGSHNRGQKWESKTSGTIEWSCVACSDNGVRRTAASFGGTIWTSDDSGSTWTTTTRQSRQWKAISCSHDGQNLVAVEMPGNIYTSTDYGQKWKVVTTIGESKHWQAVSSCSDGMHLAAVVFLGNIWISCDAGESWREVMGTGKLKEWQGIASSGDGDKLAAVVSGGNIWLSRDSGNNWQEIDAGPSVMSFAWNSCSSAVFYLAWPFLNVAFTSFLAPHFFSSRVVTSRVLSFLSLSFSLFYCPHPSLSLSRLHPLSCLSLLSSCATKIQAVQSNSKCSLCCSV